MRPNTFHRANEAYLVLGEAAFTLDPAGVLYWPEECLLVVADLHLEKGSAYAARRVFLPPYDTAATLARLHTLIAVYAPRRVLALGDSFHDACADARLSTADRAALHDLQRGRDWIWIAGNHDPQIPADLPGERLDEVAINKIWFRHQPSDKSAIPYLVDKNPCSRPSLRPRACEAGSNPEAPAGLLRHFVPRNDDLRHEYSSSRLGINAEIAGHLHPVARVLGTAGSVRRRCFVSDGKRCILPAFGAYAGGLNWCDPAFAGLFAEDEKFVQAFAYVMGRQRIYKISAERCLPD